MDTGLLWYDDSQADLSTKVQEAAQRYYEKFGKRPDRCYVNPASLPPEAKQCSLNGIKVLARPTILPDHFWLGVGGPRRSRDRLRSAEA